MSPSAPPEQSSGPSRSTLRAVAWLVALIVLTAFLFAAWADRRAHAGTTLALAGSGDRLRSVLAPLAKDTVANAVWADFVFVVVWLLSIPALLSAALVTLTPRHRRDGIWKAMPKIAIAAAVLDLTENVLLLVADASRPGPGWLPYALATAGWSKYIAYAVAIAGICGLALGPALYPGLATLGRRLYRILDERLGPSASERAKQPAAAPPAADAPAPEDARLGSIGICVSGGGIRAAGFAFGALRALDVADAPGEPSLFRRARWLSAVSGGAYLATGWLLGRNPGGEVPPPPSATNDGLLVDGTSWSETVKNRRQYLRNGWRGLSGGLANALVRTVLVLGTLTAVVAAIGLGLGLLLRSAVLYPHFPFAAAGSDTKLTLGQMTGFWAIVPGLSVVVLGIVILVIGGTKAETPAGTWRTTGLVVAGAGALLLVVVFVAPLLLRFVPEWLAALAPGHGAQSTKGAGVLALLSTLGILGALSKLVVDRVSKGALRLGGVLLALLALLLIGKVAHDVGSDEGMFTSWWPWAVGGVLLVAYQIMPAHRQTLQGVYRKRLAGTFALTPNGPPGDLTPLENQDERLWNAYGTVAGPELIVCATAHASTNGLGGIRARGFTFRNSGVGLYDNDDDNNPVEVRIPIDDPKTTGAYPSGSGWDGFPRGWVPTRSMAITGAAFASAMARQGLGTTNALLVALNLRLGCWVPNPRFVADFAGPQPPRVGFTYLVKELFGRYTPTRDPFVYVADGGHRENLGLVELLREHPHTVFVVDASGDSPGEFTTLRQAIELARAELNVTIDIDLDDLRALQIGTDEEPEPFAGGPRRLPRTCVATGTITYEDGTPATLHYGKDLVDAGAPKRLVRFAARKPPFPNYSTGNQFLVADEFEHLIALGEYVGARLRAVV